MSSESNRPEDRFGCFDDSLDEAPVGAPDPAARPWLAQQRFMHGLLRAAHTQDASAREARVQAVMARLPRPRQWRSSLTVAAALLVLAAAATWAVSTIERLPRAEAMVARALASLHEPVDRAFDLQIGVDRAGRHTQRSLQVVMRPGRRFLVSGEAPFGSFRAGCDGETVWFAPALDAFRTSVPLSEAHRLTERLGDVLDLGYLDLETLLRRLPDATELRCVGREGDGIRVEAIGTVKVRDLELRSIRMLVDDRSGLLRDVEAVVVGEKRATKVDIRLRFRHVADRQLGEDAYRRPW